MNVLNVTFNKKEDKKKKLSSWSVSRATIWCIPCSPWRGSLRMEFPREEGHTWHAHHSSAWDLQRPSTPGRTKTDKLPRETKAHHRACFLLLSLSIFSSSLFASFPQRHRYTHAQRGPFLHIHPTEKLSNKTRSVFTGRVWGGCCLSVTEKKAWVSEITCSRKPLHSKEHILDGVTLKQSKHPGKGPSLNPWDLGKGERWLVSLLLVPLFSRC